ncbi:uncharacterized protein LOC111361965 [Spodoptera litura]|uniref:Uncharacterized protein LOC111361965 n=1 Tax=Spodoptera litura TaxID=69820 RepID=A0A9J7ESJ2_SPOLT|nr:uncharacterized protein LOC111361965 [Spodoptera litura]
MFRVVICFRSNVNIDHDNNTKLHLPLMFEENNYWNMGDIPILNKKVFKGRRVTIREHPYVASIRRNIMHYSVATVLTKNLFVTVAHPLINVPLDQLGIVVGENYADRGASLLTVLVVIIHEAFDKYTLAADIALLRVFEDNGVILKAGMFCAGRSREKQQLAPCIAVPGAPMVVKGHLAGILSWGFGCGYDHDLPLIYTSIQHFQPWLVHNIPILRRITAKNLTFLFEAKRAYVLTKWLTLTRVVPPKPFQVPNKPMEVRKLDKVLAKLRGHVYDIRDYLYGGIHHKYKKRLYEVIRERRYMRKTTYANFTYNPLEPFLDPNVTMTTINDTEVTHGVLNVSDDDSDTEYYEFIP